MACLKQAFHSSGVRRPMNGAPRIFCVFPEVNATETAIPSKQASCLPALLHPRGMGGAAHRPITGKQPGPGWRTAGPDRQPDRRAPESPGGAVDGQESPLHPELHRRLYFAVSGRINTEYCDRPTDDKGRTCKDMGATNVWGQKSGKMMRCSRSTAENTKNALAGLRREKSRSMLSMLGVKKPEKKKRSVMPEGVACRSLPSG